jgi:hypothetical protein
MPPRRRFKVTRIDAARDAAGRAREQIAPYAAGAAEAAAHYTGQARERIAEPLGQQLGRTVRPAARQAAHSGARHLEELRNTALQAGRELPHRVEPLFEEAARRTRVAAADAREAAVQAASPVAHEAQARGGAALVALRGQVRPETVQALARKEAGRARPGRRARRLLLVGAVAAAGGAAWLWWRRKNSPDWLVEPGSPAAADAPRRTPAGSSVDLGPDDGLLAKDAKEEAAAADGEVVKESEEAETRRAGRDRRP